MGCKWDGLGNTFEIGEATANAEWLEEIRPFHLRHSFPIAITLPKGSKPIFIGVLDMPHWRPTYIRVNDNTQGEVGTHARTILEAETPKAGKHPRILLNEDARLTLARLMTLKTNVAEVDRYLFIYTLERMKFPFTTECKLEYIGPPVPDLSVRDIFPFTPIDDKADRARAATPVVTAIIDTEIGIANERFRSGPATTRIAHFWRQQQESMTPAKGVATGMVFDKSQIDTMLRESNGDEQDFYRRLRSGDYGSRGHVPPAKGATPAPDDDLTMTPWKREVAERLKHMVELETDDDRETFKTDPLLVEGQLVRFIKNPYGKNGPDHLAASMRDQIFAFVLKSTPDKIAETIKLVDTDDLRRADLFPPDPWQQILRDANYAARGRSGSGPGMARISWTSPPDILWKSPAPPGPSSRSNCPITSSRTLLRAFYSA